MSKRQCGDLIDTYMEYTELLESPDNYHKWCAISLIATCLRRKVWVDMGYFNIYPNMYIVLVGPAGKCRKTSAINTSLDLIGDLPDVKISADSITREALIRGIKTAQKEEELDGEPYLHSSFTIVSKELAVFLGTGNYDLLSLLTDLYDSPNRWTYKTKNMGTDDIRGVWLNLIGASTPTWLVGSVPISAIGGGFTSRVLFVVEDDIRHKVAFPVKTPKQEKLKKMLEHDLELVHMMIGKMTMSDEAREFIDHWYHHENVKIDDPRFSGYAERKQLHLLKVATVCSVSAGDSMIIERPHVERALALINDIEPRMVQAFGSIGRSPQAEDMYQIIDIIEKAGTIEKSQLRRITMRDVSPQNFDMLISAMKEMELITTDVKESKMFIIATKDLKKKLQTISGIGE